MISADEILTSHNKFHINLGLDRILGILDLLNNPQDNYKIIHVAGTNGKGSVSKIINEILIENFKNDKKIGLFTSPHLFSYTERIRVNNEQISKYIFDKLTNEIDILAKKNGIELSEFELICAVAFYYFFIKKVDYVVLETGLGGLYDATNVCKDTMSVITTIDFDHTERLGNTIEEIAFQKAGIIKENSKVIVSKGNAGFEIIKKVANKKNATVIPCKETQVVFNQKEKKNYAIINQKHYEFGLLGEHQAQNLSLALCAINSLDIEIPFEKVECAIKNVKWDFRLDYYDKKNVLIDAGHNPSGIRTLKNFLNANFKDIQKTFVVGCLKNKDYKNMFKDLFQKDDKIYFYEFEYPNALKFNDFKCEFNNEIEKISSIEEIKKIIEEKNSLKVFCGSIYMLGKIFSEIDINS